MIRTIDVLRETVSEHKLLSLHGFKEWYDTQKEHEFGPERQEMLAYEEPFLRSMSFLEMVQKQTSFNTKFTAYNMKHIVENKYGRDGGDKYVPEGILIAAAYACGFKVKCGKDDVLLNVRLTARSDVLGVWSGKYWLWDGQ